MRAFLCVLAILTSRAWSAEVCQSKHAELAWNIQQTAEGAWRSRMAVARYEADRFLVGYCPNLAWRTGLFFSSCEEQVMRLMEPLWFTKERKAATIEQFEVARAAALKFIAERRTQATTVEERVGLNVAEKKIAAVTLEFDLVTVVRLVRRMVPWNAFADIKNGKIHLGSLILLIDQFPQYLRWVFAHEIGHFAGPTAAPGAFTTVADCLGPLYLEETFADWFAKYALKPLNQSSDLESTLAPFCSDTGLGEYGGKHPPTELRMEMIANEVTQCAP